VGDPLDELRAIPARLPPPQPALARYLEQVRAGAHSLTDADVDALRAAGVTEDEIFEQTVAVAIREGLRRLDAAREAIG
jgi:alkylhydroperoxidase family enzyme